MPHHYSQPFAPQYYGAAPPPYGAYGAPPYGAYGAAPPPQYYGAPPQYYGAPPQYYGAALPQSYGQAPPPPYGAYQDATGLYYYGDPAHAAADPNASEWVPGQSPFRADPIMATLYAGMGYPRPDSAAALPLVQSAAAAPPKHASILLLSNDRSRRRKDRRSTAYAVAVFCHSSFAELEGLMARFLARTVFHSAHAPTVLPCHLRVLGYTGTGSRDGWDVPNEASYEHIFQKHVAENTLSLLVMYWGRNTWMRKPFARLVYGTRAERYPADSGGWLLPGPAVAH